MLLNLKIERKRAENYIAIIVLEAWHVCNHFDEFIIINCVRMT